MRTFRVFLLVCIFAFGGSQFFEIRSNQTVMTTVAAADTQPSAIAADKISPTVLTLAQNAGVTPILVLLKDRANLGAAARLSTKLAKGQFVYQALLDAATRSQASLRSWLDARGVAYRSFYIVNMLQVQADQALIEDLAARPEVARIISNPWIQMSPTQSVRLWEANAPTASPWGIIRINAPQVWAMGYEGQGVVVAGQDTGYDWQHPALIRQYRGWNGITADHDYNWHDAIHEDNPATSEGNPCGFDATAPCDDHSHGTHTMGTIVGDDGAENQIGVAPQAQWIGCRNMEQGWGTPATYAECFEFFLAPYPITGTTVLGDPAYAPDVINNSWSCPPEEGCDDDHLEILRQVVQNVRAAGIMVVASAGNSGAQGCSSIKDPPAIYDATYTVGSTDSSDLIAGSSSRGPVTRDGSGILKPDIAAPGVSVFSSVPSTGYGYKSGTSMASPHVVGAVALLWSARPDLRGDVLGTETILNQTAVPRYSTQCGDSADTVPNNVYGWGRVDALAAIQAALSGNLVGSVRDADMDALNQAVVTASLSPMDTWTTSTLTDGTYHLSMPAGAYTVSAALDSYTTVTHTDVIVTRGQTSTLDFILPTASGFGLDTLVLVDALSGNPGSSVMYTLQLTNTGSFLDQFEFALSDHIWPGHIPVMQMELLAGQSTTLPVTVDIPVYATEGMTDTLNLNVTSMGDRTISITHILTTTVVEACVPVTNVTYVADPPTPRAGEQIAFYGTVATGSLPITYTWSFGDGSPITIANPASHIFTPPMLTFALPYYVIVTATNACGMDDAAAWLIISNPAELYLPLILRKDTAK